jgi:hypothetical protein
MKKLITKFWGVGLIVILLSTMFVGAVPQASAATLAWSTAGSPNPALSNQIAVADVNIIKVASNGNIFVVDRVAVPSVIWKSTNGGYAFTAAAGLPAGAVVADLALSPAYASDGYVYAVVNIAGACRVYQSANAGVSFVQLGGTIGIAGTDAGTSISIQPEFAAGVGEVMVGTADVAAGTNVGNVYIWGQNGALTWTNQFVGADIPGLTAVACNIASVGNTYNVSYVNQDGVARTAATAATVTITGVGAATWTLAVAAAGDTVSDVTAAAWAAGVAETAGDTFTLTGTTYGVNFGTYTFVGPAAFATGSTCGLDITAVAYSPAHPIDQTIMAVGSSAAGTAVHFKVFTNAWDLVAPGNFGPSVINATMLGFGAGTGIVQASLAFPSDFNASNAAARTFYVGVISNSAGTVDDVYRVGLVANAGTAGVDINYDFNVTPALDHPINSLSYSGTTAAGVLYAGAFGTATYQSNAAAGSPTLAATSWTPGGAVTGAAPAYVAAAIGGTIYVGTTGAEGALNVSTSAGASFVQTGLITTTLSASVDLVTYSSTEWYLVTQNAGVNNSLWKTTNGGATWTRIALLVGATPGNPAAVRLSPAFGTDQTMYFFEVGATAAATPILRISQNAGATFAARFFPAALSPAGRGAADIVVVDANTLYVGDVGSANVYKSNNSAFFWTPQALTGATGNVYQMKRDAVTGKLLLGTLSGQIFLNALAAPEAWALQGNIGAATATVVAFHANYSTNNIIYAGDAGAGIAGIWRYNTATPTVPFAAISAAVPAVGNTMNIIVTPDGTLYAADAAGSGATGGIRRILDPAAVAPVDIESVALADGLTAGNTLFSLSYVAGSNILYAIENSAPLPDTIVTYTDTAAALTYVPGIASPADGATVPALAVVIVPIATAPVGTAYAVQFDDRADFATAGANVPTNGLTNVAANNLVAPQLFAGAKLYYRTRVTAPVLGPWSATYTAMIQMVAAGVPGPVIAGGVAGTTGPGGFNVPLSPTFNWGNIGGATSYEYQLSTSPLMTTFIVDLSGADAVAVTTYKLTSKLAYSTTYYWRVRGISANTQSAWSNIASFTTLDMPVEEGPPIVITTPPATTIILTQAAPPAATTTTIIMPTQEPEKVINPTYIWAIIIIGAVLVIAVIVLIVRTRRSV